MNRSIYIASYEAFHIIHDFPEIRRKIFILLGLGGLGQVVSPGKTAG
jgi:hypothetical protein